MVIEESPAPARSEPTRRRVLAALAAVPMLARREWRGLDPEVLVVGGGLAGLRTLDLLRRGGVDARLLEGANRVGGRLFTVREGLPGGAMVEMGGERIVDGYARVHALLRELRLEVADYPTGGGTFGWRQAGSIHRFASPGDLPTELRRGLTPSEAEAWPFSLHQQFVEPAEAPPDSDRRSALAWLRSRGLSASGEVLVRAFCVLPVASMSVHDFVTSVQREIRAGTARTLRGGVDLLTQRLAERHAEHVILGTDAVHVTIGGEGVLVRDQRQRSWRARRLVLALPLRPLSRILFAGARPRLVDRWTRGRAVAAEIRVHGDYRESELVEQGFSPYTFGLDFPRVTWARPERSGDGRRILSTVALHDEVEIVRRCLREGPHALRRVFGAALPHVKSLGPRVFSVDLNADPRIGGTFPYQEAGAEPLPSEVREGPLVLAGGDFSTWPGSIEGALASAEAAVAALER